MSVIKEIALTEPLVDVVERKVRIETPERNGSVRRSFRFLFEWVKKNMQTFFREGGRGDCALLPTTACNMSTSESVRCSI